MAKIISIMATELTRMDFLNLYPFLASMLIGALIGAERQRRFEEDNLKGVAGLRTFTLIALLGTLSATLADLYGQSFLMVAFAGFIIILGVGYAYSSRILMRLDFTAMVAAAVTYILGILCYSEEDIFLAAALGILTTAILATKKITHKYVEAVSEAELLDILKMGIMALVIYPLLPNETLDPLEVINPRQIWLMVILVSLISFSGYILIKVLGTKRGLSATGLLGGLVSSTAVATTMATEVKANSDVMPSAVFATAIASCTMFPRVLFITAVVNRDLFLPLLIPMMSMTVAGMGLAYMVIRKEMYMVKQVELKDPFRLVPALTFGAFFAVILFTSKIANIYFGDAGTYAASIISGLADVDAITLSLSTLAKSSLGIDIAVLGITLATMTNTMVKLLISYSMGTREFGGFIARIFIPMIIVGLLATFI